MSRDHGQGGCLGRDTLDGHRRPRLYRATSLPDSNTLVEIPSGVRGRQGGPARRQPPGDFAAGQVFGLIRVHDDVFF